MGKIIFDSNVWIGFLNKGDSAYKKAEILFLNAFRGKNKILLPYSVISEVYTVLVYKNKVKEALQFIEIVLNHNQIELYFLNSEDFLEFLKFIKKEKTLLKPKLSLIDIELLFISKFIFSSKLFSFDKDVEKMNKKLT